MRKLGICANSFTVIENQTLETRIQAKIGLRASIERIMHDQANFQRDTNKRDIEWDFRRCKLGY